MAHLPIWYLGKVPAELCDAACAEFSAIPAQEATMGIAADVKDTRTRNTAIRFAEANHWFGGIMLQHAHFANKEVGWDFELTGNEAVQYAEYGSEQHYHWHVDTFMLSGKPTDRKITVVCLMNDPSEFEAGELQVRLHQDYPVPLEKGTMIAFPSFLEHRVVPVTAGLRKSATMWVNGPRFR
jgi:PKHD-type hydroxylase